MIRPVSVPVVLLSLLAACSNDAPGLGSTGGAADQGRRLYEANCVACHQPDGRGLAGVYPSLAGSPVVLGDPAALAAWVVKGVRPVSMPAGRYPTAMPRFGWMKPVDAAVLLTHLRSSFGNTAPPVDAATLDRALDP